MFIILKLSAWTYIRINIKRKVIIFILQKISAIFIGSLLLGIGINGFLVPHHLLDGGITGLALIIHYYFGFPTGFVCFS